MKFLQILLIHLLPLAKSSCLSLTLQKTQHIPLSHGTFHIADNGSTIVEKLDTNLKTFTKALVTTGFCVPLSMELAPPLAHPPKLHGSPHFQFPQGLKHTRFFTVTICC